MAKNILNVDQPLLRRRKVSNPALINASITSEEDSVATPSAVFMRMATKWVLIQDLLEGIEHMRLLGKTWLPQEPHEKVGHYTNRLKLTPLYEILKDTLEKHAAMPFARPVNVNGELPPELDSIWKNVDLKGTKGDAFAKSMFKDAEKYGMTYLLVDFSTSTGTETLADEERLKLRPSFINISAADLFATKWVTNPENGEPQLTQIRYVEHIIAPVGRWGDTEVDQIRVVNAPSVDLLGNDVEGTWEVYQQFEKGDWLRISNGTHSFSGIPLVTVYFDREGFMESKSPSKRLADINLVHYQSNSDHRNYIRFARIGILFGKGFSAEQIEKTITISPNEAILTTNAEADLSYVEVTGEAIKAGERDLIALEERAEVLGMQPLIQKMREGTATGANMNERKHRTVIQGWIAELEAGIERAYELAAEWYNTRRNRVVLPEDFSVDIYSDFAVGGDPNENEFLLNATLAGKLPIHVFLEEISRRGVLSTSHDLKEIEKEVKEEEVERAKLDQTPNTTPGDRARPERKEQRNNARKALARSGPGPQS